MIATTKYRTTETRPSKEEPGRDTESLHRDREMVSKRAQDTMLFKRSTSRKYSAVTLFAKARSKDGIGQDRREAKGSGSGPSWKKGYPD